MKKRTLIVVLIVLVLLLAILRFWVFSPQRMILGTWEYDYDESIYFELGREYPMGSPLYDHLSFATETRMTSGEAYYINSEELGIKRFGNSNYWTYEVELLTPKKLIIYDGDPKTDWKWIKHVYRKK